MTNLSAVLRNEITRLSKKVLKQHVAALQRSASSHRHQIAAMKRRLKETEKDIAALHRTIGKRAKSKPEKETKVRFSAKGLPPLRNRLGLSAREFGLLVGVTGQAVYNWETRKSAPRPAQVLKIAALRRIGKREANAQLALLASDSKKKGVDAKK